MDEDVNELFNKKEYKKIKSILKNHIRPEFKIEDNKEMLKDLLNKLEDHIDFIENECDLPMFRHGGVISKENLKAIEDDEKMKNIIEKKMKKIFKPGVIEKIPWETIVILLEGTLRDFKEKSSN